MNSSNIWFIKMRHPLSWAKMDMLINQLPHIDIINISCHIYYTIHSWYVQDVWSVFLIFGGIGKMYTFWQFISIHEKHDFYWFLCSVMPIFLYRTPFTIPTVRILLCRNIFYKTEKKRWSIRLSHEGHQLFGIIIASGVSNYHEPHDSRNSPAKRAQGCLACWGEHQSPGEWRRNKTSTCNRKHLLPYRCWLLFRAISNYNGW